MPSISNPMLDRLWLALSGTAVLALALQGGVRLGQRGWSPAGAVQVAQAATPAASPGAPRPAVGCRTGGVGPAP